MFLGQITFGQDKDFGLFGNCDGSRSEPTQQLFAASFHHLLHLLSSLTLLMILLVPSLHPQPPVKSVALL